MRFAYLAATLTMIAPVAARAYCTAPSAPYCASGYGAFDDADDFDRCKRQMTNYKGELELFLSCQRTESEQAISGFNDAVARFNRRAGG